MNKKITIDDLTKSSVSVETQKYINIEDTEYELGQPCRKAYINSIAGRLELQTEVAEPYYSSVMAVWGDEPTVVEIFRS